MALTTWGLAVLFGVHQRRVVVAAPSRAAAARALGCTSAYLAAWGCPTGNDQEIALAEAQPGTVFIHVADDLSAPFAAGRWVPAERPVC
jgi:hypothetical protein